MTDSFCQGWAHFANEMESVIDSELFQPAFCTDSQVHNVQH